MADTIVRGNKTNYLTMGTEPIRAVFLHGLVADNLTAFYFTLAPAVAAQMGVLLYDLRGHGLSERPKEGYRVDDFVADLDALLTGLGVTEPVVLIGNSFGGLLTLAFAVAHPERVRGIVTVDGHLADDNWGDRMATTLSLQGQEADTKLAETIKNAFANRAAPTGYTRHSKRKSGLLLEQARALVNDTTLIADMRASAVISDDALRLLGCPVLAVYGAGSDILDHGRKLARLAPRAELRIVEGATHLVLFEATAALRGHVEEWLRALP
jgi:pimeloyl-ACP methyl ester carboxylesterase